MPSKLYNYKCVSYPDKDSRERHKLDSTFVMCKGNEWYKDMTKCIMMGWENCPSFPNKWGSDFVLIELQIHNGIESEQIIPFHELEKIRNNAGSPEEISKN
mgnify:CR=1 FL=1